MLIQGVKRITELDPFTMVKNDLTAESLEKVKDTTRYSLGLNPDQDKADVLRRCLIAQMAEQMVADHMEGWVNHGQEDINHPITFAYDVLAPVHYNGLRIEVKTHQANTKWTSVSTGASGKFPVSKIEDRGINIGPFLDHGISDVILFIDAEEINGKYVFTPKLLCDRIGLIECVRRSNFKGFYINPPIEKSVDCLIHKF